MGMGNQQHNVLVESNYQVVEYVDTYHFGKIAVLQQLNNNSQVSGAIPKHFKQRYQFIIEHGQEDEFIRKLKTHNNECGYIVQIKYIECHDEGICSASKSINVYFQYLPITLASIIQRQKTPLSQNEVWKIMKCLLIAVKFMNDKESYHGDLSPQFIYFDNRSLKYKIFDSSYFSPLKNGYYRAQTQKSYCAPEILTNISEKRTFPLYNHYISDTFSIGLILLYCMTLVCPLTAYDHKNSQINFYYIQLLFRIAIRNQYSQQLIEEVRKCVMIKNRPTVSELLENFKELNISIDNNNKFSLKK